MAVWQEFVLTGTSPAAPSTPNALILGTAQVGLEHFTEVVIEAILQGATGGVLDVYLQSCVNPRSQTQDFTGSYMAWPDPPVWYDVAHFPQLAAAAAKVRYNLSLSRGYPNTAAITVANASDLVPTLAVNTVLPNLFGAALRLIAVAGAGTSAGAVQSVYAIASEG